MYWNNVCCTFIPPDICTRPARIPRPPKILYNQEVSIFPPLRFFRYSVSSHRCSALVLIPECAEIIDDLGSETQDGEALQAPQQTGGFGHL